MSYAQTRGELAGASTRQLRELAHDGRWLRGQRRDERVVLGVQEMRVQIAIDEAAMLQHFTQIRRIGRDAENRKLLQRRDRPSARRFA